MGFNGFGLFKKKPQAEVRSIEENTRDQKRKDAAVLGAAAAGAVVAGAVGYEINQQNPDLGHTAAPSTAPAEANNPTLGKTPDSMPDPVVIPAPQAPEQKSYVIENLADTKKVVIDLDERNVVVQPER